MAWRFVFVYVYIFLYRADRSEALSILLKVLRLDRGLSGGGVIYVISR